MDFAEENIVFPHDNDPKHCSKLVKEWLESQAFDTITWLVQSPDLNPIKKLWSIVKRQGNYETPKSSIVGFWYRVYKIWADISINICKNFVESMSQSY